MARSKRTRGTDPATPTATIPRQTLLSCPICHNPLGEQSIEQHMETHRPAEPHCEGKEWKLDVDAVIYYKPHTGIFFCRECGKHSLPAAGVA